MFKGNKNKIYIQKINGLYHKSRVKHWGLQIGSHLFWFATLDDSSDDNDISLEPGYYNPNGLEFKSRYKDFIKNLRLNQKLNNKIHIK